jgi:hypothetical protein
MAQGMNLRVRDWKELNQNLFRALKLEKLMIFLLLTVAIIVASFSIVATLLLLVTEKGREIAVLKAMGASDGFITRVELQSVAGPKFAFDSLDADGDGKITRVEYDAAFRIMDRNRDGKLSMEEFNLASSLPFTKLDLDGDGFITFDEYKKGFDTLDLDGDGMLSREEFMVA